MTTFIIWTVLVVFVINCAFNIIAALLLAAGEKKLQKDLAEKQYYNPYGNH